MANYLPLAQQPQAAEPIELCEDSEIWGNLKSAIGASSGFQRWQLELNFERQQRMPPSISRFGPICGKL